MCVFLQWLGIYVLLFFKVWMEKCFILQWPPISLCLEIFDMLLASLKSPTVSNSGCVVTVAVYVGVTFYCCVF